MDRSWFYGQQPKQPKVAFANPRVDGVGSPRQRRLGRDRSKPLACEHGRSAAK